MKSFLVFAAALFVTAPAFAKITVFAQKDALKHVLSSTELNAELSKNGNLDVKSVSVTTKGRAIDKHFTLYFDLVQQQLGLNGPQAVTCHLMVETDVAIRQAVGIKSSYLTAPKLGPVICPMA